MVNNKDPRFEGSHIVYEAFVSGIEWKEGDRCFFNVEQAYEYIKDYIKKNFQDRSYTYYDIRIDEIYINSDKKREIVYLKHLDEKRELEPWETRSIDKYKLEGK